MQTVSKQHYPHLFYLLIACTLVSWLPQLMLQRTEAHSQYFTTQGSQILNLSPIYGFYILFPRLWILNYTLTPPLFYLICRACPSEFVIPLSRFRKSVFGTQLSVGMRFGMMFETEESSKRR